VGQLDPEQRYYLMSRGLDPTRADRLQVRGFFQEALNRFPIPQMVEPLRERFYQKYLDAQEGGRL
jgi:Fe-S cluster assembly protein SufD